ncbi:MAG: hypothetical protein EB127_12380 [Alphaproteobacteria bacterium]|nr:hypothetical protein [Alphaproteobacteria bacterium]
MEMKKYIDIVEAFGQDEKGEMDKRLLKAYPKTFKEKLNVPLTAAVWLASVYGGAKLGISWLDAKDFGEQILAGGLGGTVAAVLGTLPAAITSATLDRNKARSKAKEDEINDFISKNPNIKTDLENFVKMLITQTPQSILKDIKYLEHVDMFGKKPRATYQDTSLGASGERIELAVKNLASLISNYFDQQDEKWQKLAAKYKVDSPTLYQIWQHTGGINHIHGIGWEWENGVKQLVSAPTNEEPIEEASDEAIARIVELSKDKK